MSLHGFSQLATPYLEQKLTIAELFSKKVYFFTVNYEIGDVTYVIDRSLIPDHSDLLHVEQNGDSSIQRYSSLSTEEITVLGVVVAIVFLQSGLSVPENNDIDAWLMPERSTCFIARSAVNYPKRNIKIGDLLIVERDHEYGDDDLLVLMEAGRFVCREIRISTCELVDADNNVTKITKKLTVEGAVVANIRVIRKCKA
ncbi:hypothetical protein [Photobacterium toruni]|uniref:Peptidase S24/S26A/S26B/S26C domain-containing protein n=1 Tax=Photobacterium toruni TaxID=1935446 RepID=A0A1T4UGU0_9GAMM|nr:hypothetical protein [Photobacterium toruni]SKA51738.1 hypothetical protein CZ814_03199 [Photobacterium toruni]